MINSDPSDLEDAKLDREIPTITRACGLQTTEHIEWFEDTMRQWAVSFALLVPVHMHNGSPRKVVRFSYEEDIRASQQTFLQLVRRFLFGGPSLPFNFDVPAVADCESYHLELLAPPPLELVETHIVVQTRVDRRRRYWDSDAIAARAHVYVDTGGSVARSALARGSIFAPLRGMYTAALVSASFSFVVLFAAYQRVSHSNFELLFPKAQVDVASATALLLLVPGAIVTVLFRDGEGRLRSRVFGKIRVALALGALSCFAAAFVVGFRVDHDISKCVWKAAVVVSFLAALRVWVSLPLHLLRISSTHQDKARARP